MAPPPPSESGVQTASPPNTDTRTAAVLPTAASALDEPVSDQPPSRGRALVPFAPPAPPSVNLGDDDAAFRDLAIDVNVRNVSPRQMADVSLSLYAAGVLSWEEYAMLAFQPELHPDYERTIGALTGEKAAPNLRRDFVTQWERRLAFERRHNKDRAYLIERTRHILNVLTMLDVRARLLNIA